MKSLIIIVPGTKIDPSPLVKKVLFFIYFAFKVDTKGRKWAHELKKHLAIKGKEVIVFDWPRGFSRHFSLVPAAKKLTELIKEKGEDYDKIIIFGKSLGGVIGKLAVSQNKLKVSKIVYISTPHKEKHIDLGKTKQINIYSSIDNYTGFANRTLYLEGGEKRIDNGENIELSLRHGDFNRNVEVEIEDKKTMLFNYYRKLLD
jgi:hypothetical protein